MPETKTKRKAPAKTTGGVDINKKVGPLPLWGWGAVGLGAWFFYTHYISPSQTTPAPDLSGSPSFGGIGGSAGRSPRGGTRGGGGSGGGGGGTGGGGSGGGGGISNCGNCYNWTGTECVPMCDEPICSYLPECGDKGGSTPGAPPPPATGHPCPAGYFWNGMTCVPSSVVGPPRVQPGATPPPASGKVCNPGYHWNGFACVQNTGPGSAAPSTTGTTTSTALHRTRVRAR